MLKFILTGLLLIVFSGILPAQTTVTYTPSTADIVNPDRGFYHPAASAYTSNFQPLSVSDLISRRTTPFTPDGANYQVRTSLIFRYYVLDSFVDTDVIAPTFLAQLQEDFDRVRAAGVRLIPRFAYTISPNTSCGVAACAPYGDVPLSRALAHIQAIAPVLRANPDVLSVVQQGFIGTWGENFYTDHFGDASALGDGRISNANWIKRNTLTTAMLAATPPDRMVQLRYAQLKQRYLGGPNAPVTQAPMTEAQAHTGSDRARLGFHNDCFLASSDDYGTYYDYGNDGSFPQDRTDVLKPYFAAESQYVAVGGETCDDDNYDPQNNCSGDAVTDMDLLNYSFLNAGYNLDVNNDWQTGGCMGEIKRKLGYRLVLKSAQLPDAVNAGNAVSMNLTLENVGFTAPYNERKLYLVLRRSSDGSVTEVPLTGDQSDSRFWQPGGDISLVLNALIPNDLPAGNYELLLHLLDPTAGYRVALRPEYSVQFANQNLWEPNTGFNALNHTLTVQSTAPNCSTITVDGNYGDWTDVPALSTNGSGGLTQLKMSEDADDYYFYASGNLAENLQFYLNSGAPGGKYTGSSWSSGAFDFFVENETLYQYNGSGFDFNWTAVGMVDRTVNGFQIELRIPKTQVPSVQTVGFESRDSGFSSTGRIPNGASPASYVGTDDPCACVDNALILNGLMPRSRTYHTNADLTSRQIVIEESEVVYSAATGVTLAPGFEVSSGSTLTVLTESCTSASRPDRVGIARSSELPEETLRMRIAPNPTTDRVEVRMKLPMATTGTLRLLDARGRVLRTVFSDQELPAGDQRFTIELSGLAEDIVLINLRTENTLTTGRIVRLRSE